VEGDAATGKRREGLDCEDGGGRHYAARARACRPSFLQAIGKVLTLLLGTLLFEKIGRCRVLTLGRTWGAAGKAICAQRGRLEGHTREQNVFGRNGDLGRFGQVWAKAMGDGEWSGMND
jgi:hypothetical protein